MGLGSQELKKGINIIGYFQGSFGLGESARLIADSLQNNLIPFSLISADLLMEERPHENFRGSLEKHFVYPINLFCLDPRHLFPFIRRYGWDAVRNRHNIGMCFWETNVLPNTHRKMWGHLDEIWTATRYVQEHLSIATSVPVYHVSQPVRLAYTAGNLGEGEKSSFGLPNKFTFLFCFCFHSVIGRKNPLAIIKAFRQAFPDRQDVQVVIKSQNGHFYPESLNSIMESIKDDPRIIWIDQNFSSQRRFDLMNACDCYISLHRSEGFGLTMAEAMLLNKPVIATAYSGNLDFMTEENSFLCSYTLVRIGNDGRGIYPPEGIWADVDIDQAAYWMNYVVTHPSEAKAKALQGKEYILKHHSCTSIGKKIAGRIAKINLPPKPKPIPWVYSKNKIIQLARSKLGPVKRSLKKTFSFDKTTRK